MKTFKQFLKEANESSKYKEGDFGYWWTIKKRREDIEGKVYDGNLLISGFQFKTLKGCPKEITGSFNCTSNEIKSLEGCPKKVGKNFYCDGNNLTSLEGAPKEVGGDFGCSYNKLSDLKKCPKEIKGNFRCSYNKLTSLEGAPKEVGGDFVCTNNKLSDLKGAPEKVNKNFYCSENKLTSLEGCPKYIGGLLNCSYNKLTSLEGIVTVKGDIISVDNNIKENPFKGNIYVDRIFNILYKKIGNDYIVQFDNGDYKVKDTKIDSAITKFYKKIGKYEDDILKDLYSGKGWLDNSISKTAKEILKNIFISK